MENGPKSMGGGGALKRGLTQAISLWPATLFLFLANAAQALVVPGGALLFRLESVGAIWAGLLALATVWLLGALLRALALGGAVREASLRLRGLPAGNFLDAVLAVALRSLGYLAIGFLLDILITCYRWIALLATGGAYLASLVNGRVGALSSGALALAIVVCWPLGLMGMLWTQVALARAVARDEGYLPSLSDGAAALWARPWPAFSLVAATAVIGWSVELFVSLFTSAFTQLGASAPDGWAVVVGGQVVSGVLSAFVWAVMDIARLDGLAALELDDAGLLPSPPRAAPPVPPPAAPETPPAPPTSAPPLPEPPPGLSST